MNNTKTTIIVWAVIGLACWFILNKATSKENKQTITIQKGGTATIVQGETQKMFKPFTRVYGEIDTNGDTKGVAQCGIEF